MLADPIPAKIFSSIFKFKFSGPTNGEARDASADEVEEDEIGAPDEEEEHFCNTGLARTAF